MLPDTTSALLTLLDAAELGLAQLDHEGRVLNVNPAFERLVGWSDAELESHLLDDLSAPTTAIDDRRKLARSVLRREQASLEMLWRRRLHGPLRVQLDIMPVESGTFLALAQDAGLHRARLLAAADPDCRVESSRRVTGTFLAHVSHELRTPLNAVIGFAEMIEQDDALDRSDTRDHAQQILSSGRHLLGIVNDLLDLAHIANDELALVCAPVDVQGAARRMLRAAAPEAEAKGVLVELVSAAEPCIIEADERRLAQVLRILIGNAVKFTPAGGQVTVKTGRADGVVTVEICDTGCGMDPAEIQFALLPFLQADSSSTREREGTGIGLPIAKALVELHGGKFEMTSRRNAGTSVLLTLPCASRLHEHGGSNAC